MFRKMPPTSAGLCSAEPGVTEMPTKVTNRRGAYTGGDTGKGTID